MPDEPTNRGSNVQDAANLDAAAAAGPTPAQGDEGADEGARTDMSWQKQAERMGSKIGKIEGENTTLRREIETLRRAGQKSEANWGAVKEALGGQAPAPPPEPTFDVVEETADWERGFEKKTGERIETAVAAATEQQRAQMKQEFVSVEDTRVMLTREAEKAFRDNYPQFTANNGALYNRIVPDGQRMMQAGAGSGPHGSLTAQDLERLAWGDEETRQVMIARAAGDRDSDILRDLAASQGARGAPPGGSPSTGDPSRMSTAEASAAISRMDEASAATFLRKLPAQVQEALLV